MAEILRAKLFSAYNDLVSQVYDSELPQNVKVFTFSKYLWPTPKSKKSTCYSGSSTNPSLFKLIIIVLI